MGGGEGQEIEHMKSILFFIYTEIEIRKRFQLGSNQRPHD